MIEQHTMYVVIYLHNLLCKYPIIDSVSLSNFVLLQDFSEANVLKSLTTLNQILQTNVRTAADNHNLATTWTVTQSTVSGQKTALPENKDSSEASSKQLRNNTGISTIQKDDSSTSHEALGSTITIKTRNPSGKAKNSKLHPKFDNLEVESFTSEDMRPTTPVSVSAVDPCFSRLARSMSAPCDSVRSEARGGVRSESVKSEARDGVRSEAHEGVTEMEALNESTVESKRQITVTDEKLVRNVYITY